MPKQEIDIVTWDPQVDIFDVWKNFDSSTFHYTLKEAKFFLRHCKKSFHADYRIALIKARNRESVDTYYVQYKEIV